jgi:hypothetical protein
MPDRFSPIQDSIKGFESGECHDNAYCRESGGFQLSRLVRRR